MSQLVWPSYLCIGLQVVIENVHGDVQISSIERIASVPSLRAKLPPLRHDGVEVAQREENTLELRLPGAHLHGFLNIKYKPVESHQYLIMGTCNGSNLPCYWLTCHLGWRGVKYHLQSFPCLPLQRNTMERHGLRQQSVAGSFANFIKFWAHSCFGVGPYCFLWSRSLLFPLNWSVLCEMRCILLLETNFSLTRPG